MNQIPLSLLHISDLHFLENGRPGYIGRSRITPNRVIDNIGGDDSTNFLLTLKDYLINNRSSQDSWPKVVIVNGDLVENGDNKKQFEKARNFLMELSNVLNINSKSIYVVPGNHDVDWSQNGNARQEVRFENYLDAVQDFSSPTIENGNPLPLHINLSSIREGVDIELVLFISPTFSGVSDVEGDDLLLCHFKDIMNGFGIDRFGDAKEFELMVRKSLERARHTFDIGAFGDVQRSFITKLPYQSDVKQPIRIAVLHHHLLPDPQLDVKPFDAIIDAGRVLECLIRMKFDLVLTGHKHNQRLVRYRYRKDELDIYSAPSLFAGHAASPAGFTIIDIMGANAARYAKLNFFKTENCEPEGSPINPINLVRTGRVIPDITEACANISPSNQQKSLPILNSIRKAFEWSENHPASKQFEEVWEKLSLDLENVGNQKLIFRPPLLHEVWKSLIELAATQAAPIRLVSENDIEFFHTAIKDEYSHAAKYEKPLRKFQGEKFRIMVLSKYILENVDWAKKLIPVVNSMLTYNFKVIIVMGEKVPNSVNTDFGIISDMAVSQFDGRGDILRELCESFNSDDLEKANLDWKILLSEVSWDSTVADSDIQTWLSNEYGHTFE